MDPSPSPTNGNGEDLDAEGANEEESGKIDKGKILVLTGLASAFVLIVAFITRKLWLVCKRLREENNASASAKEIERRISIVAVESAASNRSKLSKSVGAADDSMVDPGGGGGGAPGSNRLMCLNCSLIAMGEAAAYADGTCPQCGFLAK